MIHRKNFENCENKQNFKKSKTDLKLIAINKNKYFEENNNKIDKTEYNLLKFDPKKVDINSELPNHEVKEKKKYSFNVKQNDELNEKLKIPFNNKDYSNDVSNQFFTKNFINKKKGSDNKYPLFNQSNKINNNLEKNFYITNQNFNKNPLNENDFTKIHKFPYKISEKEFLKIKQNLNSYQIPTRLTDRSPIRNLHIKNKKSDLINSKNNQEYNPQITSSRYSGNSSYSRRTKSISSISFKTPKFTVAIIEKEKHLMHEYIKDNFLNVDEEPMYGKFGRPKTAKRNVDYGVTFNKYRIQNMNDPDFSEFKKYSEDPSIGPKYLDMKYPVFYETCKSFYKNQFKENYSTKTFRHFLFAKKINKDIKLAKYPDLKKTKYAQISKIKIKWKTIKWLMEHEKNLVKKLVNFHKKFKSNPQNEEKGYTREEFFDLMRNNGISNNADLINKLFWIFDENGDDQLKIKELALGLEMFRDSSLEEKLKAFYDLCDEDNSGSVSKGEFLKILKNNLINNDEKSNIKQVVDRIYSYYNLDDKGELSFDKLKEACIHNKALCDIIEKNLYALKSIDNVIDEDLKNNLMIFNHNMNQDLKLKLLDVNSTFMPIKDEKFQRLLDDFTQNKQNILDYCMEKEEGRINNLIDEEFKNEATIFAEEREYIRKFLRSTNKK